MVPTSKPKSRVLVWIVAGVATLAIGVGLAVGKYSTPSAETPVVTPDINREPTGSTAAADWKAYINTRFGFTFKYPSSWPAAQEEDISSNSGPLHQQILFMDLLTIHARDERYSSPATLEDYTRLTNSPSNTSIKDVSTESFRAFKTTNTNGDIEINISKDLKSIKIISFNYNQKSTPDPSVFDQILSTFRFGE